MESLQNPGNTAKRKEEHKSEKYKHLYLNYISLTSATVFQSEKHWTLRKF